MMNTLAIVTTATTLALAVNFSTKATKAETLGPGTMQTDCSVAPCVYQGATIVGLAETDNKLWRVMDNQWYQMYWNTAGLMPYVYLLYKSNNCGGQPYVPIYGQPNFAFYVGGNVWGQSGPTETYNFSSFFYAYDDVPAHWQCQVISPPQQHTAGQASVLTSWTNGPMKVR